MTGSSAALVTEKMIFVGDRINTIGLRIEKLPAIDAFEGDEDRDLNPLEQFYTFAAQMYFVHGGMVFLDVKKVHVCPADAEKIYAQLRGYYYSIGGPKGAHYAAQLWMQLAPREMIEVPPGYVFVEQGCLFIKPEGDVSPRVEH